MQSTEYNADTTSDFNAVVVDLAWLAGMFPQSKINDVVQSAVTALAAERDRADRAKARIAEAWDEAVRSANLVETDARLSIEHDPNPYRSKATA